MLTLATVYDGPAEEGETALAPLQGVGEMVTDFSGRMPYARIQCVYDPTNLFRMNQNIPPG